MNVRSLPSTVPARALLFLASAFFGSQGFTLLAQGSPKDLSLACTECAEQKEDEGVAWKAFLSPSSSIELQSNEGQREFWNGYSGGWFSPPQPQLFGREDSVRYLGELWEACSDSSLANMSAAHDGIGNIDLHRRSRKYRAFAEIYPHTQAGISALLTSGYYRVLLGQDIDLALADLKAAYHCAAGKETALSAESDIPMSRLLVGTVALSAHLIAERFDWVEQEIDPLIQHRIAQLSEYATSDDVLPFLFKIKHSIQNLKSVTIGSVVPSISTPSLNTIDPSSESSFTFEEQGFSLASDSGYATLLLIGGDAASGGARGRRALSPESLFRDLRKDHSENHLVLAEVLPTAWPETVLSDLTSARKGVPWVTIVERANSRGFAGPLYNGFGGPCLPNPILVWVDGAGRIVRKDYGWAFAPDLYSFAEELSSRSPTPADTDASDR